MKHLLAFDRASVRSFDVDGRLHVDLTNISMEQVAEYLGREIPDWEELGLDPKKVYRLYRSAVELEKAASTFNKIPVLSQHVPVSAANHRPDLVIGATGSDAVYVGPHLKNSMVIWVEASIEKIESDEVKEISCAYRYVPVLKPGKFNGQSYDIEMTELQGNHVAIVAAGRAGPTVVVGDSLPKELLNMKKTTPSRMALIARGALLALNPRMAADSKLDLSSLTNGITAKDWLTQKPVLLRAIKVKLANDADVGTLHKLLDGLDGEAKTPDMPAAAAPGAPGAVGTDDTTGEGDDPAATPTAVDPDASLDAVDADPCADLMSMLAGKLSPEEMAAFEDKLRAALTPAAATDEAGPPETPGTPAVPGAPTKDPMITKPAMDAALARVKNESIIAGRALARAITEAEQITKPYVGVMVAMDSAEETYKGALELLNIDTTGMHPSAYRAVLEAQPKPGSERAGTPVIAQDAKADMASRFPNLDRIRVL